MRMEKPNFGHFLNGRNSITGYELNGNSVIWTMNQHVASVKCHYHGKCIKTLKDVRRPCPQPRSYSALAAVSAWAWDWFMAKYAVLILLFLLSSPNVVFMRSDFARFVSYGSDSDCDYEYLSPDMVTGQTQTVTMNICLLIWLRVRLRLWLWMFVSWYGYGSDSDCDYECLSPDMVTGQTQTMTMNVCLTTIFIYMHV